MQNFEIENLAEVRKNLHANAELSGQEVDTQKYLQGLLESLNYDSLKTVAKTGLLVAFKGKSPGKSVLLRGDIDALPIDEINSFDHISKNEGVSHKCGHDGHAAIMLGVAKVLSDNPPDFGMIYILFQPSEENGKGAAMVLDDPNWKDLSIDYTFSVHNLPRFEMHQVVTKSGPFTASAESLIISMKGKTSHAAEPEKGRNPAYLMAKVLSKAEELILTDTSSDDFFLITPVFGKFGAKAYGTAAGKGEIHLTLRAWTSKVMEEKRSQLVAYIDEVAQEKKFKVKYKSLESFATTRNAEDAIEIIKEAAEKSGLDFKEISQPFKWGEDYGLFTQNFTGAMLGLGAGINSPALHNPDYDFPDEILETGVNLFYEIAKIASQK